MDKRFKIRQNSIESLKLVLDEYEMLLVPIGMVRRGPLYVKERGEDDFNQMYYNGYPCVSVVFSIGIPKDQIPPNWLMDIIANIEDFAIQEIYKIKEGA